MIPVVVDVVVDDVRGDLFFNTKNDLVARSHSNNLGRSSKLRTSLLN